MSINLMCGNCLELLKTLPDNSVDMVLTDPPYGTTACQWDKVIPFDQMWSELKRVTKDNGAIVLFGSEPFSSQLRLSNLSMFRYDWIWDKGRGYNFATVKHQPFRSHEIISVFSRKATKYYPIKTLGKPYVCKQGGVGEAYGLRDKKVVTVNNGDRYPLSIQKFGKDKDKLHPTQKPVALCEYLISTYTDKGDVVLDFTMGSGTTGVACVNTGRRFIGIELNADYFQLAKERICNQALLIGG